MTETGLFQRIDGTRRVRGLLLPFGELSRPNLSGNEPVMFSADSITLPRDPSVVTLNRKHDRFDPIGRAVALEKTPAGVVAEFEIAETDEGDSFLASPLRKLSAEVAELVRAGANAVRSKLTGAAAVDEGAFASAALFAVADGVIGEDHTETVYTDENGREYRRVYDSTTEQTTTDAGVTTITTTTITETTDPAEPDEGEADMANAQVPSTLLASKAEKDKADPITSATFSAMIANAIRQPENRETMLAALNDVKIDGANAVGTGAIPPEFIGEIWSGIPFVRRVIPLLQHGDLTSLSATGWRWTTEPEVAEWAGNKAAVPSNTPATEPATWGFQRFAGGWDIAREFIDFGETEVINSFLTAAAGSYAKKSDAWVLTKLLAAGTAMNIAAAVPADVPAALVGIVDGALALIAADARPSYALVNPADYRPLLFTKKSDVLEYLNLALGLEDGDLSGFKIVPHTGIPAGTVTVGAREAAAVHEMPGSPIRVNALDMVKGGVDEALFGYVQFRDYYAKGIQNVTLTPAGA